MTSKRRTLKVLRVKRVRVRVLTPIRCGALSRSPRSVSADQKRHLLLLTAWHNQDAGAGALAFDAMAQEGLFVIENISFYSDGKLGTEMTAEADWKRRGLYIGPQVRSGSS